MTLVGSIVMGVDTTSHWLVTGDVDGVVKSWDIHDYLDEYQGTLITDPPSLYISIKSPASNCHFIILSIDIYSFDMSIPTSLRYDQFFGDI